MYNYSFFDAFEDFFFNKNVKKNNYLLHALLQYLTLSYISVAKFKFYQNLLEIWLKIFENIILSFLFSMLNFYLPDIVSSIANYYNT